MTGATPGVGTRRGIVLVHAEMANRARALAELRTRFAGCEVEVVPDREIGGRVRDARKAGMFFVAVAGDDAAIRCAAEELAHGETALLPIPEIDTGRFATSVGIELLDDAQAAARAGCVEPVDLGRVNDRGFVNFASVGFARDGTTARSWRAVARALLSGPRIRLRLDRQPVTAWFVFVGNGCYGQDVHDIDLRENIDEHLLDVRVVRAERRLARTRLALALLTRRAPVVERRTCRAITIDVVGREGCDVTLDGEPLHLSTPLRFESDANALAVIRPPAPPAPPLPPAPSGPSRPRANAPGPLA